MDPLKYNTLYIKTNNKFLQEKYKSRFNYVNDCGVDLFCPEELVVPSGSLATTINFQIECKMVSSAGHRIGYMLVPRSSISKTPLRMSNSIGIIDPDYRGSIMAKVDNILPRGVFLNREFNKYTIEKGQRLFQLVSPDLTHIQVKLVQELDETQRGSGGFGSTGT